MSININLTGVYDESDFVNLEAGRYEVVTKGEWYAKESVNGNINLQIPFTITERSSFEGRSSNAWHTIMVKGDQDNMKINKTMTLRLFARLGLITESDRGSKGDLDFTLQTGAKNQFDKVPVTALVINDDVRKLGGREAVAVVVSDSNTSSGVKVTFDAMPGGTNGNGLSEKVTEEDAVPLNKAVLDKGSSLF